MAHTEKHIEALIGSQEVFEQFVQERLRQAVRVALISVLEEEVTAFVGATPYERDSAASGPTQWALYTQSGDNDGTDHGFTGSPDTRRVPNPTV